MTAEELLKPRVKVVAPYPFMATHNLKVGDVLTKHKTGDVTNQDGTAALDFDWGTYPHIFNVLSWYEERTLSDFPKYICGKHRGDDNCVKVEEWTLQQQTYPYPIATAGGITYYPPYSTPISEDEYNLHKDDKFYIFYK